MPIITRKPAMNELMPYDEHPTSFIGAIKSVTSSDTIEVDKSLMKIVNFSINNAIYFLFLSKSGGF